MAFPSTGVLDALSVASISGNWSLNPFNFTRLPANPTGSPGWGTNIPDPFDYWWNASTFGPDMEARVEVTLLTGSELTYVYARLQQPSPSTNTGDAYVFAARAGATSTLYRFDNCTVGATLGSYTASVSARGFGIETTGTGATVTIKIYEFVGGSWTLAQTFTDSSAGRIVSGGYAGFLGSDSSGTVRWKNWGAGTIVNSQTVAIGQVTSTTTARAVTYAPPALIVGQVACTTVAQPITARYAQTTPIGQVQSATTAQPVNVLASSNTQAQGGLAWLFHRGKIPGLGGVIGQVQTTTTVQGISSRQTVGQARVTVTARPVTIAGAVISIPAMPVSARFVNARNQTARFVNARNQTANFVPGPA